MSTGEKFQPSTCKKCGMEGLFYLPIEEEQRNNWDRIDQWGRVVAFESPFDIPHWYICPEDARGSEHRKKLQEKMTKDQQEFIMQKEHDRINAKKPLAPGQRLLPSDKLTDIDRSIAEKVHVIELLIDEIKALLNQKAA